MSRSIVAPTLAAILGIVVGGASVDYIHRHNDKRTMQAFAQKELCRNLANGYKRENTKDGTSVVLREVGFSPTTNSCIAAIINYTYYPAGLDEEWELVDLLSGKENFIGACSEQRDCGNGRNVHFGERLDIEFKSAIDGTQAPPDTPIK